MKINEFIEWLNRYCEDNEIYSTDSISDDDRMEVELEKCRFEYITSVDSDEHRWYVLANNVYSVTLDGCKYYIGTWEVETIKSECMSVSDCEHILKFIEMEPYTTISYRKKSK